MPIETPHESPTELLLQSWIKQDKTTQDEVLAALELLLDGSITDTGDLDITARELSLVDAIMQLAQNKDTVSLREIYEDLKRHYFPQEVQAFAEGISRTIDVRLAGSWLRTRRNSTRSRGGSASKIEQWPIAVKLIKLTTDEIDHGEALLLVDKINLQLKEAVERQGRNRHERPAPPQLTVSLLVKVLTFGFDGTYQQFVDPFHGIVVRKMLIDALVDAYYKKANRNNNRLNLA